MFFSDSVTLRSVVKTQGTGDYPVSTNTDTNVFANIKSASRAEFYAANANGVNASLEVEVHLEDWGNQTQLLIGTKVYDIIRSYQKGLGIVSLTCSDKGT